MVCGSTSQNKWDQHAAGFENRKQIVKGIVLYLVRHHRCETDSAVAEITARQKKKVNTEESLCDVF
jgi:hypothetical protein